MSTASLLRPLLYYIRCGFCNKVMFPCCVLLRCGHNSCSDCYPAKGDICTHCVRQGDDISPTSVKARENKLANRICGIISKLLLSMEHRQCNKHTLNFQATCMSCNVPICCQCLLDSHTTCFVIPLAQDYPGVAKGSYEMQTLRRKRDQVSREIDQMSMRLALLSVGARTELSDKSAEELSLQNMLQQHTPPPAPHQGFYCAFPLNMNEPLQEVIDCCYFPNSDNPEMTRVAYIVHGWNSEKNRMVSFLGSSEQIRIGIPTQKPLDKKRNVWHKSLATLVTGELLVLILRHQEDHGVPVEVVSIFSKRGKLIRETSAVPHPDNFTTSISRYVRLHSYKEIRTEKGKCTEKRVSIETLSQLFIRTYFRRSNSSAATLTFIQADTLGEERLCTLRRQGSVPVRALVRQTAAGRDSSFDISIAVLFADAPFITLYKEGTGLERFTRQDELSHASFTRPTDMLFLDDERLLVSDVANSNVYVVHIRDGRFTCVITPVYQPQEICEPVSLDWANESSPKCLIIGCRRRGIYFHPDPPVYF